MLPSDSTPFSVAFAHEAVIESREPNSIIVITPRNREFNDFGFHTNVWIYFYERSIEPKLRVPGYLAFLHNTVAGRKPLLDLVGSSQQLAIPANWEKFHYFTMLNDMQAYRDVVKALGSDQATQALAEIRDLVTLKEFKPSTNWLKDAYASEAFSYSFMRSYDSYFCFRNAASILRGLKEEEIGKLSESFSLSFQIPGTVGAHEFTFQFKHDGILPKRIAVLIGKNGVGKSQTLNRITRSILQGTGELTESDGGMRPAINRLLAFAPTNEAEMAFPPPKRQRPTITYKRFSLNRSRRTTFDSSIANLLRELALSHQSIKENSRWEIFVSSIKEIGTPSDICLMVGEDSSGHVPLSELLIGDEHQRLTRFKSIDWQREPERLVGDATHPLSSGEISLLRFAAQICLYLENGSLVLLDEPETHLHPNFVSIFAELLNSLLALTGSVAIIATHSVYFVKEVFREQVHVIRRSEDGGVEVLRPRLRTFGGDVGAISTFVFGETRQTKLEQKIANEIRNQTPTWNEAYEIYKDEFSMEFLLNLKRMFEFNS
jgi:energy-coupling factor transporter ATP-binding protein EcfA2